MCYYDSSVQDGFEWVRPGGGLIVYEAAATVEAKISEGLNHDNAGAVERRARVRETWVT